MLEQAERVLAEQRAQCDVELDALRRATADEISLARTEVKNKLFPLYVSVVYMQRTKL